MMPISDSFAIQRCLTWTPQPQLFPPRPPADAYCRPVIRTRPVSGYHNSKGHQPIIREGRQLMWADVAPYQKSNNSYGEIYPQEVYRVVRRPTETQVAARRTTAQNRVSPHFHTNQPYGGARLGSAASSTSSRSSVPGAAPLPQYYALNDPHLYDFYVRKFMTIDPLLPTDPKGRTNRRSVQSGRGLKRTVRRNDERDGKASYRVAVVTGDKRNAGTDAKVFITIKGSKGKLAKRHLAKKTTTGAMTTTTKRRTTAHALKFNRGTTHVFKFDAKDVGDLSSIIIEHDGVTEEEGWYLDHVKITKVPHRTSKEQTWLFICQNWLSLHDGDCLTRRQIYTEQSAKTEYEIVAVTGNVKGAGTDANVFLTIFGKTGQSQKLPLRNRENENPFERNKSDVFIVKSNCVGQMTKIRIEHDNTGMAPGWFLDRVVVTDLRNPKWKYYFPCGQWLAKDEGDGQTSRDLQGSLDPLAVRKMNQYRLTVYTGDKRNGGTDANVTVTLFGDVGESGERRLDTRRKNDFERGSKDEFVLECPSLGTLQRLRVSHDNSGASPGWFLDKVIVDDMERNRVYEFPCGRWLARDEDDGQTSRDLVCGVSADDAHPGVPYKITVKTGDVSNAGTSAGVYVVLYGGKAGGKGGGDRNSGKIWLRGGKFERGRTDIFDVEVAEKLSPLTRIDIGHDNKGVGPGWFLDEVTVFCPSAGCEQLFRCGKWLATDEGDKQIERTLHESERRDKEMKNTWFVWIYTGDQRGGGTDANVFLVAYGKNKNGESVKSDVIPLDNKGDSFEVGQVDKFKVEMIDIGKPYKIRIGHDDSKPYAGWMLDKVEMEHMGTKKRYTFNCGRWLAKDEDDGSIIRELPAEGEHIKRPEKVLKYAVSVFTGKKLGAGTNANVFLNVFGEQGDTGERPLDKSSTNKDKFEKGNTDEFVIEAVNLKKLKKIRVGHDGKNPGSGWFLDKVIVKPVDDPSLAIVFECNRWLDTKEDDGAIVRELTAAGTPQMLSTTSYHVSVKTGKNFGAGTDANVFLQVFGEKGDTGRLQLKSAEKTKNKFEAGRLDLFNLEAEDIGKIKRIRIGHDGTKPGSGWFLDEVKIDVPSRGECYYFAFHRWLDKKEDDGQIELEMEPTNVEKGNVRIPYELTIWTGDVSGGGTDANVFIQMYGEGGKTEEYSLRNKTDNFEKGQVDKFKIEASDVGPLLKIRVGHDGSGSFAGWFLDKILIQRHPSKTSKRWSRKHRGAKQVAPRRKSMDNDDYSSDGGMSARSHRRRNITVEDDDESDRERRPRSGSIRRPLSRSSNGSRGSPRSPRSPRSPIYESDSDYESKSGTRHGKVKGRKSSSSVGKSQGVYDSDSDDDVESRSRGGRRKKSRQYDDLEEELEDRRKGRGGRKEREREEVVEEADVEDYWFVCGRWFAKNEDDHKIVRELLPTTEDGKVLDGGLQEVEYIVKVFTGDKRGAGTDANVFINITGEMGDTGERHLQESNNTNKFERNKEDIFQVSAVELGQLKKVKIRHDNKGGGAAWFLDHIEVEDPKTRRSYYFPCNRWLATNEDDGQISRDLLPIDKRKMSTGSDAQKIQEELALEAKALMTTFHVFVYTGDKFGAGTDANVYIVLFGEIDDSGVIFLKTSKNNKNKFERKQMDEFVIEAIDIGELKKIKIGHDNAGGGGAWFLDHVEIDSPSLGKKWYFPHGRWLAKDKDDGKLERELYPQDMATEEYAPCIPYEITTYTSELSGAGTSADVHIVLYGRNICTTQKLLCANKQDRKKVFEKGKCSKFIIELEDIGDQIEKIRIGHDGSGLGAGWHLDRVEVRRLKASGKGSETYVFPCNRWLAKDEDDGAIERELVPEKIVEETTRKDGTVKKNVIDRLNTLSVKKYRVNVVTGNEKGCGTDANVFLTMFGEQGDSGERQLKNSETNRNKFERGQTDIFGIEAADLGKLYKVKIRHDNSSFSPAWFLDRVEVTDPDLDESFTFHCERWLGKSKDDGKIERTLYVKGFRGDMSSSTLRGASSMASLDSIQSDPFGRSPRLSKRQSLSMENIPEGPTIPYTVRITTGSEKDMGTETNAWIKISGRKKKLHTGKVYLDAMKAKKFRPGSVESFALEAVDIQDVKEIELGHDNITEDSGWYVEKVEVDLPTKGKHYIFPCQCWLAMDKPGGKTSRVFTLADDDKSVVSYKPMVPYEVSFHTGDTSNSGTDAEVFIKVFGQRGSTAEIPIEKGEDRFERGKVDLIKMELDDIAPLKKLRIGTNGKGTRPDWFLDRVELRNMETGDLTLFNVNAWLSKKRDDQQLVRDVPATVRGKVQLKTTTYKVKVKTSDVNGAGTDANVYVVLFGENGDSGELHLKQSETNKNPFENGQEDVFTVSNVLSLGHLIKLRVWHDNRGLGAAWHLGMIEVEDCGTSEQYVFLCDRWLSKKDDDKQICRELICSNLPSPGKKDKITYEIEVSTVDKAEAGTGHNAWIILEGEQRSSTEFIMENTGRNRILQRGQTDSFKMVSRNLGKLSRCVIGAFDGDSPRPSIGKGKSGHSGSSRDREWMCGDVMVTDTATGDRYIFKCNDWVEVTRDVSKRGAKILRLESVEESQVTAQKNLGSVKYDITVVTGTEKGGGTNANVFLTIYGSFGDSGKRPLTQKFRDLFERGQTDNFQIEAVELGDLKKVRVEHDNSGLRPGWFLDHIVVTNKASNRSWTFPCSAWLDKEKGDKHTTRELFATD